MAYLRAVAARLRAGIESLVRRNLLALGGASLTALGTRLTHCMGHGAVAALCRTGATMHAIAAQLRALGVLLLAGGELLDTVPHALGTLDQAVSAGLRGLIVCTVHVLFQLLLRASRADGDQPNGGRP